jgi:uncharacterized membrane protein
MHLTVFLLLLFILLAPQYMLSTTLSLLHVYSSTSPRAGIWVGFLGSCARSAAGAVTCSNVGPGFQTVELPTLRSALAGQLSGWTLETAFLIMGEVLFGLAMLCYLLAWVFEHRVHSRLRSDASLASLDKAQNRAKSLSLCVGVRYCHESGG